MKYGKKQEYEADTVNFSNYGNDKKPKKPIKKTLSTSEKDYIQKNPLSPEDQLKVKKEKKKDTPTKRLS